MTDAMDPGYENKVEEETDPLETNGAIAGRRVHYPNLIAGIKAEIANRKSAKIAHIAVFF